MVEHYGVVIKPLTDKHFAKVAGGKQSFTYLPREYRLVTRDSLIRVEDTVDLLRFNTKLIGDNPINYLVVLGNADFQLIFASDSYATRVILVGAYHKQGIAVNMPTRTTEPILGLVDFINYSANKPGGVMDRYNYINSFANKLLQQHAISQDIVKAIYRDGV